MASGYFILENLEPVFNIKISIDNKFLMSSGLSEKSHIDFYVPDNLEMIGFTHVLREFRNSTSIWGSSLQLFGLKNDYDVSFTLDQHYTFSPAFYSTQDKQQSSLEIHFTLERKMLEDVIEPDSIVVGITKVGALLGLLKVFSFFNAYHEWQFERKLAREHGYNRDGMVRSATINDDSMVQENEGPEKPMMSHREFFSFKNFKKMHETLEE